MNILLGERIPQTPNQEFHDRRGYVPDLLIRVPPLDSAEPGDDVVVVGENGGGA